jgi:CBS domain-containing protein
MTEVATQMMERYVRHVLVEEDGRLIGIVSARDLLGAYALSDTD